MHEGRLNGRHLGVATSSWCQRDLFHLCTQATVGFHVHHASSFVVASHIVVIAFIVPQVPQDAEALFAISLKQGWAAQHVYNVVRASIHEKG